MMNALPGGMLSLVPAPSLSWLALSLVACYPPVASARPTGGLLRRQSDSGGGSSSEGGLSANVWLPILIVIVAFAVLVLIACIRRCVYKESGAGATPSTTPNQPAGQAPTPRPGRRRRPARTPSQISTKSLPPYMKEPGDQELVIFKGPSDMEDEGMPVSEEEDDEHLEPGHLNPSPDDAEPYDTTRRDTSVTTFMHNASNDVSMRRSVDIASLGTSGDSHGSHSELLPAHPRQASEVPLEEAPPYFEVIRQDVLETSSSTPSLPEASIQNNAPGDRRSRFSFLLHPFGGSSRYPPVSVHNRAATPDYGGSSLSLVSTGSGHRRNRGASSSGSGLFKVFGEHSVPITSPSTISVDSISAPLTYTLKRSEFRAPKGGLTPEQIKLITSRDALERFGAPYGPDALAFSASRSDMVPPPAFESATSTLPGQASMSSVDFHRSNIDGPSDETSSGYIPDASTVGEAGETALDSVISGTSTPALSGIESNLRSSSLSPPTSYHLPRGESRASSVTSFETAVSQLSPPATPLAARPATPETARPILS